MFKRMNHSEKLNLVKLVASEIADNFSKPKSQILPIPPFIPVSETRFESSVPNNGHGSIVYVAVFLDNGDLCVESRYTDRRDGTIMEILRTNFPQGKIYYTQFDQGYRPASVFRVEY